MNADNILVTTDEAITTIAFNRPKALNALNLALLEELFHAVKGIRDNPEVRVLVLTGVGEKAFVAGADIKELDGLTPLQAKAFAMRGQGVIDEIAALPIPVIAAVNGYALGGGAEMALACDFIYASETASFGLPETNLGLIPGFGGTQRLARLIGTNQAKELIFTGRIIAATQAQSIGLVNCVFPAEELMAQVMATAQVMAGKGRTSLRAAKEAVDAGMDTDLATGLKLEQNAFALCMASDDAREGTRAFIEKRKANFKGSF